MKLAKTSLITALAVSCLGSVGFAADESTLEKAIKNVSVDGYLRYRLNSDAYEDKGGVPGVKDTTTTHQYRALANFKAAPTKYISMNLGILYINEGATTNTGFQGKGLGASEDGDFGVSSFYATLAHKEYTSTTLNIGKQLINTPVTNAGDFDRGTGAIITNQDIPGLTLVGAAFDTYALSDLHGNTDGSITKPLFGLAGVYKIPNLITAELWYFNASGVADSLLYGNIAYDQNLGAIGARFGVSYAMAQLSSDTTIQPTLFAGQETENDLLKISAGASLGPVALDAGYLMNTKPGYSVSFDDQGKIIDGNMGQIWWQNAATKSNIGIARRAGGNPIATAIATGAEDKLSVIYATLGAKNISDTGLGISLTYVNGSSDYKNGIEQTKRSFQEIVPIVNYQYNAKLSFSTYYSMLTTDIDINGATSKESRNRYRFQTLYKF